MRLWIERDAVVPAAGGATQEWAIGYMSSDMVRVTDWNGATLGMARVVTSWPMAGSCLSDRQYQVEAMIDGAVYTGRTLGAGMLWKGRVKRRQFSDRPEGKARRMERRAALVRKGVA